MARSKLLRPSAAFETQSQSLRRLGVSLAGAKSPYGTTLAVPNTPKRIIDFLIQDASGLFRRRGGDDFREHPSGVAIFGRSLSEPSWLSLPWSIVLLRILLVTRLLSAFCSA